MRLRDLCAPAALLALPTLMGCNDPREQPTLCLHVNDESAGRGGDPQGAAVCDVDATSEDEAGLLDCPTRVTEGSAFLLRHVLPAGVEPVGELQIHVDAPCDGADRDLKATHVDGVALVTGEVPAGASCGLSVSAVMANSELRCEVLPATPCADLTKLCGASE